MANNKPDMILSISPAQQHDEESRVDRTLSDLKIERFELPVKLARQTGYLLLAIFLLILLWSIFAQVNVIAQGPGQLQPYGRPKLIQSQVDGQLSQINVKEGQRVRKGEALATLSSEILQNAVDEARMKLQESKDTLGELKQAKKAIEDVIKNPALLPPLPMDSGAASQAVNQVYTNYKNLQESRFDAQSRNNSKGEAGELVDLLNMKSQLTNKNLERMAQLALQKQQSKNTEAQKEAEISGLLEQIASHKEMLKELQAVLSLSKEQKQDYSEVLDLGVSRVQFLNISEKVVESKRQVKNEESVIQKLENDLRLARMDLPRLKEENKAKLAALEADIEQERANIESVNLKIRKNKREFTAEQAEFDAAVEQARAVNSRLSSDIDAQQAELQSKEAVLRTANENLDKGIIRAALSGTVTNINVRGPGEFVRAGQELMQILPEHSEMVIAAKIPNRDIGFVKTGQEAKIKLDAFPFQDFGVLQGRVQDIERYPEKDGRRGWAYTVWIQPRQYHVMVRGKEIPLKSGLTADCEIVVRKVSVLRAILDPLAKLGDLSIKD